jgi:hypothetical protein
MDPVIGYLRLRRKAQSHQDGIAYTLWHVDHVRSQVWPTTDNSSRAQHLIHDAFGANAIESGSEVGRGDGRTRQGATYRAAAHRSLPDGSRGGRVQPCPRLKVVQQTGLLQWLCQLCLLSNRRIEVIFRQKKRESVKEEEKALHLAH